MVLKAFVGAMGAGKTAMMTYDSFIDYNKGRNVYANYNLKYPHKKVYMGEIMDEMTEGFADSYVALDEGWLFFESRRSGKSDNLKMSQFILQSRKLNVDIAITAQSFMQVDKRFGDNCHYLIECLGMRGNICYFLLHNYMNGNVRKGRVDVSPIFDLYDTDQIIIPGMSRKVTA